ncbi:MAG TPA: HAD-IC family P-type ATPase, partial [Ktedonobacterales bacterium]|nr:HAD-IC family P-type ATPase [Ktedonobacterales bacterium]
MTVRDADAVQLHGLTREQVADRLRQDGYNELPSARQRGILAVALEVVREPMFLLLIAGGAVYLVLGDFTEALALLFSVFLIIGITLYQERKTERALEALRDLSSPRALVIRDGVQERIAGRDVVRGDAVVLAEGDRIPADGILRQGINLTADESLLTGESVPVSKVALAAGRAGSGADVMGQPGGDSQPYVYSGTLVVQGRGIAEVLATGPRSAMGTIGRALQGVQTEQTPLQRETGRLVRLLAIWGLFLCAVLVIGYGLIRGQWLEGVLAGIALAMSVLPEEFPVVLTVFLALGAWRIAQKRVLTRRVPTVETLGAATALCVDKTGTLTQNRMSVRALYAAGATVELAQSAGQPVPHIFHDVAEYSMLASHSDPFDPMEKAILAFADIALPEGERPHSGWTLMREYPLTPELLAVTRVWAPPDGGRFIVAAKGAPEAVAGLCHLDADDRARLMEQVAGMVKDGLRVLGVARARHDSPMLPGWPDGFAFQLVGLIGLADPIRPEVPAAVQECYDAGVRVVMITGDYPGTAQAIARQIGLRDPEYVITGPMLRELDDATLRERIQTTNIFARVAPEQKLRLVEALKVHGDIVAMTGDGVNDAPALKAAHIGIAM